MALPGDVYIDEFISPKPVGTLGIFTLQPFSLMPPVAAPDLSSRPGPRARFTLVRPGEATVILKCPGRRYHSVERVADSMFFGVSTWTFRFLNFSLASSPGAMYRTSCFKKQRFWIIMQHAILLSGRVDSHGDE